MTKLFDLEKTALIIIDIQEKLLGKIEENQKVVETTRKMIKFANIVEMPVIVTEQYPRGIGPTVEEIRKEILIFEPIQKMHFSCFGAPEFVKELHRKKIENILLAGIETHVCVCQTALEGIFHNYNVGVIEDGVSSRSLNSKKTALDRMRAHKVEIVNAEMIMLELLKEAGTQKFKKCLELIR